MYKCYKCEAIFEEPECYSEKHTELLGQDNEYFACCPECGEDFGEAEKCKLCGDYFFEDEISGDCCHECLEKQKRNYEILEKISEDDLDEVKIPRLISSVLSVEEIKTVLYRYIEEHDIDCSAYMYDDIDWFSDRFIEEVVK